MGLFPEWQAQQIHKKPASKQIGKMYRAYKMKPGKLCKTCCFLMRTDYHNHIYYKCQAFGLTHGAGSDWRTNWIACGLFGEKDMKTIELTQEEFDILPTYDNSIPLLIEEGKRWKRPHLIDSGNTFKEGWLLGCYEKSQDLNLELRWYLIQITGDKINV